MKKLRVMALVREGLVPPDTLEATGNDGRVFALEANANPNLSYGEDFAESAEQAGINFEALLQRIINLACDTTHPGNRNAGQILPRQFACPPGIVEASANDIGVRKKTRPQASCPHLGGVSRLRAFI